MNKLRKNIFLRKILSIVVFLIFVLSCKSVYTPSIVKDKTYMMYDISFEWSYLANNHLLNITLINTFWTDLFNVEISVAPVDKNFNILGDYKKCYIGDLDYGEKFATIFYIFNKKAKYLKVDYYYEYTGYNSAKNSLEFHTIYLKIK